MSASTDDKSFRDLGVSKWRIVGGKGHFLKFPWKKMACIDEETFNSPIESSCVFERSLYHAMPDAANASTSIPGLQNLPSLLPDLNDGGWQQINKAVEASRDLQEAAIPRQSLKDQRGSIPAGDMLNSEDSSSRQHELQSSRLSASRLESNQRARTRHFLEGLRDSASKLRDLVSPVRRRSLGAKQLKRDSEDNASVSSRSSTQQPGSSFNFPGIAGSNSEHGCPSAIEPQEDQGANSSKAEDFSDMDLLLARTFGHAQLESGSQKDLNVPRGSKSGRQDAVRTETKRPDAPGLKTPSRHSNIEGASNYGPKKSMSPSHGSLADKAGGSSAEMRTLEPLRETAKLAVHTYKVTMVNHYALMSTLGQGSFGIVKLGLDTHNLQLYALKLLSKSTKSRSAAKACITDPDVLREVEVMKQLDHPNIVKLHEVIDDPLNCKILLVTEYAEGGALFSGSRITPKRRLTELMACRYLRDVLQGLDYLFAHNIAHNDLKPSNFLLASTGAVKIADFGSSQLVRYGEVTRKTTGTPSFLSPEAASGEAYDLKAADVWSLGVCLWVFLFGSLPFKADTKFQLYNAIQRELPVFPPGVFVSDSVKHLLTRMLDKDPKIRISLVGIMSHPWVTSNGAHPLPNLQGLQNDEECDTKAILMECWPAYPVALHMRNIISFLAPAFERRLYRNGNFVVKKGDPVMGAFYIKKGEVIISDADFLENYCSDENDEFGALDESLVQVPDMLKTMYKASEKASELANVYRLGSNGRTQLNAIRTPGMYISEVSHFKTESEYVTWSTSIQAKGDSEIWLVPFIALKDILSKHAAIAEAAYRAIQAQRQAENQVMAMLEQLASLHNDLRHLIQLSEGEKPATLKQSD